MLHIFPLFNAESDFMDWNKIYDLKQRRFSLQGSFSAVNVEQLHKHLLKKT